MIGFGYPYLPAVLELHVCETYAKYDASCLEFKISMNKQPYLRASNKFTCFLKPLNMLLPTLKNVLELEYGPIGIKSLCSEPLGNNEYCKEIQYIYLNVIPQICFHIL
jgi:hypothetical protein